MAKTVWRKGALHTHTLWSDGRSLPEAAVKTYKDLGYDFMCITEHNVFPEGELWLPVAAEEGKWPPNLSREAFGHAQELLPDKIIFKKIGVRSFVRLRTFRELKRMFDEKNKFLLVPGEEITVGTITCAGGDMYQTHFNTFNVAAHFPRQTGETPAENYKLNYARYREKTAGAPEKSFFTVNHPFHRLWDIDPMILVENPEITHFEICNSDTLRPVTHIFTPDKFWDFVLAHRIVRGYGVVYATASDDAHYYRNAADRPASPDTGWVMVNCPGRLTSGNLARAMNRGDFYATCGVELESVVFDGKTGRLSVKVKPEKDTKYTISFIVTKKDFDRTIIRRDFPAQEAKYARNLPVIPRSIGKKALTVAGTEGSYTLKKDDLYVRAVIVSDKKPLFKSHVYPKTLRAWTQPFLPPEKRH